MRYKGRKRETESVVMRGTEIKAAAEAEGKWGGSEGGGKRVVKGSKRGTERVKMRGEKRKRE